VEAQIVTVSNQRSMTIVARWVMEPPFVATSQIGNLKAVSSWEYITNIYEI